jgi:hypothetical protein
MKIPVVLLPALLAISTVQAQTPLSPEEALRQLYRGYDAATKTARWECTTEQKREGMHAGWPCSQADAPVSISVLLNSVVREGETSRAYFAVSAKPNFDVLGYDCHGCAPAFGAAVFRWKARRWVLESSNPAVGFYGGWGEPPGIELVQVGPTRHGLMLSTSNQGQGYASSRKDLVVPLGRTVLDVWGIQDEADNLGAVDPDDNLNKEVAYKVSATFRFLASSETKKGLSKYFDIEVTSSGTYRQDSGHPVKPEDWTEIYRFRDGVYRLLSHQDRAAAK